MVEYTFWDQKGEVDKNTFIHTLCYIAVNFSMGSNFVVFLTFQNYKSKHRVGNIGL